MQVADLVDKASTDPTLRSNMPLKILLWSWTLLTDYGWETPIGVMYVMHINGDWRQLASKPIS